MAVDRFERDHVVSFVPPDGTFELMRYRVNTQGTVAAPCYCQPSLSFDYASNHGSISVVVGQRVQNSLIFPANKRPNPFIVRTRLPDHPFLRT